MGFRFRIRGLNPKNLAGIAAPVVSYCLVARSLCIGRVFYVIAGWDWALPT